MADAPSPHGLNSVHHSGILDDSQAPQFLLTDGTRQLAGNMSVAAGITIDGVDISVLDNNYQTHLGNPLAHNYVRNLLDDSNVAAPRDVATNDVKIYGINGTTVTKTVDGLAIDASGGGGGSSFSGIKDPSSTGILPDGSGWILTTDDNVINVAAGASNTIDFSIDQSAISHDNIGGVSADDHHTAFIGIRASDGNVAVPDNNDRVDVYGDGTTINTSWGGGGAPNQITVSLIQGGVDHGSIAGLADDDHTQYVHVSTARTISAKHTFNPSVAGEPFTLGTNAIDQNVAGFDADSVDGYDHDQSLLTTASPTFAGLTVNGINIGTSIITGLKAEDAQVAVADGNNQITLSGTSINTTASGNTLSVEVDTSYGFAWTNNHTISSATENVLKVSYTGGTTSDSVIATFERDSAAGGTGGYIVIQYDESTSSPPELGDTIGGLKWRSTYADSTYAGYSAKIDVINPTVPSATNAAGAMRFFVTPDGSTTLSEAMRIHENGQVSIGTASSGYGLRVNTTFNVGGTSYLIGGFNISSGYRGSYDTSGGTKASIRSSGSSDLIFETAATDAMTIDSLGDISITAGNLAVDTDTLFVDASADRVGINTSGPNEALEVAATAGSRIIFSDGAGVNRKAILFESPGTTHAGYGRIDAYDYGASSALDLTIAESGGRVLIGSTTFVSNRRVYVQAGADYPLVLDSTQRYLLGFAESGVEEWWIASDSGSFVIHEDTVGDKLTIAPGGNVTLANDLTVSGGNIYISDTATHITEGNLDSVRVTTAFGWLEIAAMNDGWGHIQTDRPLFYMNKGLFVDTGVISSYDEDLMLQTSGTNRLLISNTTGRILLQGDASFESDSFVSGWAGAGFRLEDSIDLANTTRLEVDEVTVRGRMRVYELLVQQIRATNGSIFVSSTGKVDTVSGTGPYTITTDEEHGFLVNDLIIAQRFTGTGTYLSKMTVTAVTDTTTFDATLEAGTDAPVAGMEYVRVGNTSDTSRQGSIYMSADDTNAPFIDIIDDVDSWADWGDTAKTKVRVGNLAGITNPDLNPTGYGIYSDNAYMKGKMVAGSGGEVVIDDDGISVEVTSTLPFTWTTDSVSGYAFTDSGGTETGGMWSGHITSPDWNIVQVDAIEVTGKDSVVRMLAETTEVGQQTEVWMIADHNGPANKQADVRAIASNDSTYITAFADTINLTGNVGIHASPTAGRLHVKGSGSTSATNSIYVENSASTGTFAVRDNGDAYINRYVGIGIDQPKTRLHILGGVDAGPTTHGYLVLGSTSGFNMVLDDNEIMARNNGAVSPLYLNWEGGDVNFGTGTVRATGSVSVTGDLVVDTDTLYVDSLNSKVGISTSSITSGFGFDVRQNTIWGAGGSNAIRLTNQTGGAFLSYLEWVNGGTRQAYMGWEPSRLQLRLENGYDFYISGGDLIVDTDTLYVDSLNGRVGIGDIAPDAELHVNGAIISGKRHGASSYYGLLGYRATDAINALGGYAIEYATGKETPIIYGYDAGSSYENKIRFSSVKAGDRSLETGRTDRMVIDMYSGNVGIGTTSTTARFQVESEYSGGSGDYTNVTNQQLSLVGTGVSYPRVSIISGHSTVAGVVNAQTGKDLYWGESTDTGAYRFRGRNLFVHEGDLVVGSTGLQSAKFAVIENVTNSGGRGEYLQYNSNITSTGTYYPIAKSIESSGGMVINSGVTNNGYQMGINNGMLRYTASDVGTLNQLIGSRFQMGHYSGTATARTTNYIYGLKLDMYHANGTIGSSYGIFIQEPQVGATFTGDRWSIYSNSTNLKSYHAGPVLIGTSSTGAYQFDVNHDAGSNWLARFHTANTSTPYGVLIQPGTDAVNGYPVFAVLNNAGNETYFRVDSGTGNVGIYSAPDTSAKLKVGGDVIVTASAGGNGNLILNSDSANAFDFIFQRGGSGRWSIYRPTNADDLRFYSYSFGDVISLDYAGGDVEFHGYVGFDTSMPGAQISFGQVDNERKILMWDAAQPDDTGWGKYTNELRAFVGGGSNFHSFYTNGSVGSKQFEIHASYSRFHNDLRVGDTSTRWALEVSVAGGDVSVGSDTQDGNLFVRDTAGNNNINLSGAGESIFAAGNSIKAIGGIYAHRIEDSSLAASATLSTGYNCVNDAHYLVMVHGSTSTDTGLSERGIYSIMYETASSLNLYSILPAVNLSLSVDGATGEIKVTNNHGSTTFYITISILRM